MRSSFSYHPETLPRSAVLKGFRGRNPPPLMGVIRDRGRLYVCSKTPSCCDRARFSVASSPCLQNSAPRETKIVCIGTVHCSQTRYLIHLHTYVRTGASVAGHEAVSNGEALGDARKCDFSSGCDFREAHRFFLSTRREIGASCSTSGLSSLSVAIIGYDGAHRG